jgi:hypothetical protein
MKPALEEIRRQIHEVASNTSDGKSAKVLGLQVEALDELIDSIPNGSEPPLIKHLPQPEEPWHEA